MIYCIFHSIYDIYIYIYVYIFNKMHMYVAYRVAGEDIVLPIQSARIRSINSFSFRYGRVEVRAKMPRGDWIWPGKTAYNILEGKIPTIQSYAV